MTIIPQPHIQPSSCAECFIGKHKCSDRLSMSGCCSKCTRYIRMGLNNRHLTGKIASMFPYGAVSDMNASSYPRPIEAWDTGLNTFQVTVLAGDDDPPISMTFRSCGQFSTNNGDLITSLDSEIRRAFSASLEGKNKGSNLIASAVLAGGYAHLLCSSSTTEMAESVQIVRDGIAGEKMYGKWDLEVQLRQLMLHRLAEVTAEVMKEIRLRAAENHMSTFSDADAYSAAIVLRIEVGHFRSCLKHGHLRGFLRTGLPAEFLAWLSSIEKELIGHIRVGCGTFPHWRSPIKGSVKRLQRRDTTLAITIFMQHNTYSSPYDWTRDMHIPYPGSTEVGYTTNSAAALFPLGESLTADQVASMYPPQHLDYYPMDTGPQLLTSPPYTTSTMHPAFGSDNHQVLCQPFTMADFEMPAEVDTIPLDPRTTLSSYWTATSGQFF